ncbi:hypothetical protein [Wenyingzhuangia aestuarii]|uniref:hypothetical protein n=1 Tax=Wenyingzhuangia aestuarii TaxID=1647582 RepID=UPI0014397D02|nr:hypothetical protein [Wenyingzhuangia aestuarii]NJB84188.1 hypothetical protein [Wenyingzhuangia aestuarii]
MKNIFLIILFLSFSETYSCTCAPMKRLDIAQVEEYEYSEFVLIGEIIEIDNEKRTFKVKVKETFKGNLKNESIIEFRNHKYCEPVVEKKSEWLIYSILKDNKFEINTCGTSRDLNNLERLYIPPPPPVPNDTRSVEIKEAEIKNHIQEMKKFIKKVTENEINRLRKLNS